MGASNERPVESAFRAISKRNGAYLPHWTRAGAWYSVTFRLWDSLPEHVVKFWRFERENIRKTAEQMKRPLSERETRRLAHLYSDRIERYLDAGYGACYMKDAPVAKVVRDAMQHFDGQRYRLAAWCVMPNHVHVVVQPFTGLTSTQDLSAVLHSWKSFTSKEANKLLHRSGEFWQTESYDHLIRNSADMLHAIRYVLNNPRKAGLMNWKWVGISELGKSLFGVD